MTSRIPRRTGLNLAALCSALLSISCASRQDPPPLPDVGAVDFEQIQTTQAIELLAGMDLEVSNPFGDIHLRKSADGKLSLSLFLQRKSSSPVEANIRQHQNQGSVELTVVSKPGVSKQDILRIDLVVMVPDSPRLRLNTHHGMIDARKITNPLLEAFTDSGEIRITTASIMHAHSKQGIIRATIMRPGWNGVSQLSTEKGIIYAFFPFSPNLQLTAKTRGAISNEFDLVATNSNGLTHLSELRGSGKDGLDISSMSGNIELYGVVFDPREYATIVSGSQAEPASNWTDEVRY